MKDERKKIFTPSGSSGGEDNLEPKLTHIRKKLLHAQQSSQKSWNKGGKKKSFKITKRFKDDMPPLVPKKKKKVNPNSPPDEENQTQMSESSQDSDTRNFVTQLKLKKRTLGEMCDKIQ